MGMPYLSVWNGHGRVAVEGMVVTIASTDPKQVFRIRKVVDKKATTLDDESGEQCPKLTSVKRTVDREAERTQ